MTDIWKYYLKKLDKMWHVLEVVKNTIIQNTIIEEFEKNNL